MLARGLAIFIGTVSGALAHGKPFPHTHTGWFHPEELLLITIAISVALVGGFFGLKHLRVK